MGAWAMGPDGVVRPVTSTEDASQNAVNTGWNIFEAAREEQRSGLYRSRENGAAPLYPSCSRALARIPRNTNDANGYYASLGLDPWASMSEIKTALRSKLACHHPDGPDPDLEKFMRFKEIHTVFTNPIHKANYDSIPPGRKLIDSEVQREMEEAGLTPESPGINPFETTPEDMGRDSQTGRTVKPKEKYWDYLATDHNDMDLINAQEWYGYLLELAPMFRYDGTIKVLLHDGRASALKKQGGIMLIPRTWEPSADLTFHMLIRHIGWPDTSKPRYPVEEPGEAPVFQGNWSWSMTDNRATMGTSLGVLPTNVRRHM